MTSDSKVKAVPAPRRRRAAGGEQGGPGVAIEPPAVVGNPQPLKLPAVVGNPQPLKLPHERDESVDAPVEAPTAPMRQAYRDVARGLADTDRGAEVGRTYARLKRRPATGA